MAYNVTNRFTLNGTLQQFRTNVRSTAVRAHSVLKLRERTYLPKGNQYQVIEQSIKELFRERNFISKLHHFHFILNTLNSFSSPFFSSILLCMTTFEDFKFAISHNLQDSYEH